MTTKKKASIKKKDNPIKRVIDADNQKILEIFNPKLVDTSSMVAKYEAMGKWNDVGVDVDGDIILWEE